MEFTVTLDRFSGPYTKLLEMIEERKLSITEVSLSQVADDYITYVQSLPQKDYVDISQFIVVAATLMLIKVKALLPGIAYTEGEEEQIHDLEKRLMLHQTLRAASKQVHTLFGKTVLRERIRLKLQNPVFTPSTSLNKATLHSIALLMKAAFERIDRVKAHVIKEVVRLEEVMDRLRERISQMSSLKLSEFAQGMNLNLEEKKKTLIVSFLAILELVKGGMLSATQEGGDILIENGKAPVIN
jgi:segregation and condensation protein A